MSIKIFKKHLANDLEILPAFVYFLSLVYNFTLCIASFFKKIYLFICLTQRMTVREGIHAEGMGEEEAAFLPTREPCAGLHPRTLGSRPERKAEAEGLSHPGAPLCIVSHFLFWFILNLFICPRERAHKQAELQAEAEGEVA